MERSLGVLGSHVVGDPWCATVAAQSPAVLSASELDQSAGLRNRPRSSHAAGRRDTSASPRPAISHDVRGRSMYLRRFHPGAQAGLTNRGVADSTMNDQLLAAVEYCHSAGIRRAVFVVPFEIEPADAHWLRAQSCCAGMVLRNPAPEITAISSGDWLGRYTDDGLDWVMPGAQGRILFVGPLLMITRRMVRRTARSRERMIICKTEAGFVPIELYRFVLWRLGDATIRRLGLLSPDHPVIRFVNATKRVNLLRTLWHRLLRRHITAPAHTGAIVPAVETSERAAPGSSALPPRMPPLEGVALYRTLLARARESARTAK